MEESNVSRLMKLQLLITAHHFPKGKGLPLPKNEKVKHVLCLFFKWFMLQFFCLSYISLLTLLLTEFHAAILFDFVIVEAKIVSSVHDKCFLSPVDLAVVCLVACL